MGILGARAFECGNSMLNTVDRATGGADGSLAASAEQAKTGTYSLKFDPYNAAAWARWAVAGTPANASVSAWIYPYGVYSAKAFQLDLVLTSGESVGLRWDIATHTFDADVDGAEVAAGTIEVSSNDWFNVQLYAVIDNAGSIGVKIDGHQSITYNGDTLPGGASAEVAYIRLYVGSAGGVARHIIYVDDLVWGTGGYLGAKEVYDKIVDADDVVAWTPLTGADNYAMEDEVPNSDADYNETAVDGTKDQLELAALDLTGLTVDAVIAWSRVADPGAHGSSILVGIDSNGTESANTSALAAAFEYYWGDVEEVDPDDSAAWDQAKVDAVLHLKESLIP